MKMLCSQTPKLALSNVWGFAECQTAKETCVFCESVIGEIHFGMLSLQHLEKFLIRYSLMIIFAKACLL